MVTKNRALFLQLVGLQIIRVEVSTIACQDCLFAVLDKVARVYGQVLDKKLLYYLRMVFRFLRVL